MTQSSRPLTSAPQKRAPSLKLYALIRSHKYGMSIVAEVVSTSEDDARASFRSRLRISPRDNVSPLYTTEKLTEKSCVHIKLDPIPLPTSTS